MKLIKVSTNIIDQENGLEGIYKAIELAGRTCYKSEDKITPTSAEEFVNRMIKSGHYAMLEFGTVYLRIPMQYKDIDIYSNNPYSKVSFIKETLSWYITTNYRVIIENNLLKDLDYLCEPTEYHEKRICVRFTMDRIGSQSLCRRRVFSFAQESTRYCNYSKDKFGNELTFIIPSWLNIKECTINTSTMSGEQLLLASNTDSSINFIQALSNTELNYFELLRKGHTPQEARQVLPNALKTEINMCGFVSDWKHFFKLRDSTAAHPDMKALATPLHEEFKRLLLV